MKYNFDEIIDRSGTYSMKYEQMPENFSHDAIPMWLHDMDFPCSQAILDALHQRVDRKIFGFTTYDCSNIKKLVSQWFLRRHDCIVDPKWVCYAPSEVSALSMLTRILADDEDYLIIQPPVFQHFSIRLYANKCNPLGNFLKYDNGSYSMDLDDLKRKLSKSYVPGIIICNPQNPTGTIWDKDSLRKLVSLAKQYGKWIISDEVHGDITRTGNHYNPIISVAEDYLDQIMVITSPSVTFNIPGLKIANIIIPNDRFRNVFVEYLGSRIGMRSADPLSIAACEAAYIGGEEWLDQVREYIDGNIAYAEEFIKENLPKIIASPSEATYFMWLNFKGYFDSYKKLENWIVSDAKVGAQGGSVYGMNGAGFVRLNVAYPRSVIEEAMKRLLKALK